jgi:hypothetical protein
MVWVKYDEYGIVNLDKITHIYIREADTRKLAIYLHDGGDNIYHTKVYTSWDECMKAFNGLIKCLEFGIQFIDMTNIQ